MMSMITVILVLMAIFTLLHELERTIIFVYFVFLVQVLHSCKLATNCTRRGCVTECFN